MIQNKNLKTKIVFAKFPKLGDEKLLAPERKSHLLLLVAAAVARLDDCLLAPSPPL